MDKYIIRITVVDKRQDGNRLTTCIYCVECGNMAEALRKAECYAFFQLDEENADYISSVGVEKGEVEE